MATRKPIKIKNIPIPQVAYTTMASETFEGLREYYASRQEPIPQSDIQWYIDELAREKKELEDFWKTCPATKAILDAVARGEDELGMLIADQEGKKEQANVPAPIDMDPGPMPAYGTKDFWAWCHRRKQIRLKKEAAIIAAGGTVPPQKVKKPRSKKGDTKAPQSAQTNAQ